MSSAAPADQDALVAQLVSITGLSPSEATQYLNAANGDIEQAAALFFEGAGPAGAGQEEEHDDGADAAPPAPQQQTGGGRTLGGAYVPAEASSSGVSTPGSSRAKQPQRGLRTLKDLQASANSSHAGHGHDGDDDDDDDHQHDFYTGGEKSGLSVENPAGRDSTDHINSILKRARQQAPPLRDDEDDAQTSSRFRGSGMTLGGDDTPSRAIPDVSASRPQPAPRVHRELHLWRDGFSVDDGPLYRYDDPANARTLEMIHSGHAPLHLLNVEHGQEVDVEVHPHKDEDYKKPKKKYVPFSGSGQRLGSPTPGATSTPAPAPPATMSTTAASSSPGTAQQAPQVQIDDQAPTITLQIRLGDGSRLQSRFNTTHTVGDVYGFVDRASPASTQRSYALMTTFPSKELTDKAQALGDMAEFKRGGVVVQKWT